MIEAVIIDFDDTLCLTEEGCFGLENETLRRMGREPMSREIHMQTWGQLLGDAIQLRSPGIDLDEFWRQMPTVHEEFIAHGLVDVVTEENIVALDRLASLGKRLMVLTSRTETEVRHLLDPDHHLAGRLTAFYHKDNMEFHKPDPRAFQVIERDHGLSPQQCVYVGDNPSDAAAANGAELFFIANLESGIRSREDFAGYRVDQFVNTFPDVVSAVQELDAA
ncbi:HAD family hydrolase [Candidatus Saccharibacteria bacterium]|nr:HAD family hydrolase [Candidatus Saccharibacteria bacterium]